MEKDNLKFLFENIKDEDFYLFYISKIKVGNKINYILHFKDDFNTIKLISLTDLI